MRYLVTYDIVNNKSRKIISDFLISKGFIRIQRSVFLGKAKIKNIKMILERIAIEGNIRTDNIMCVHLSEEDYRNMFLYGEKPNLSIFENQIIYL